MSLSLSCLLLAKQVAATESTYYHPTSITTRSLPTPLSITPGHPNPTTRGEVVMTTVDKDNFEKTTWYKSQEKRMRMRASRNISVYFNIRLAPSPEKEAAVDHLFVTNRRSKCAVCVVQC